MDKFWPVIKRMLLGLIGSKKFIVTISGFIVAMFLKYKIQVDPVVVQYWVGLVALYVGGQSVADIGKEKAKIDGTVALAVGGVSSPVEPVKDKLR